MVETSKDGELTQAILKQNILINASETVSPDQTGWLPVQSSRGIKSFNVYYDVDANYIDAKPIQNHTDNHMIPAYWKFWAQTNCGPKSQDQAKYEHLGKWDQKPSNWKSKRSATCNWYNSPDIRRRNLAEMRAIQNFKSHFIAILAMVNPSFPMSLVWDHLVSQAVMILNLFFCQSNKTPSISAY